FLCGSGFYALCIPCGCSRRALRLKVFVFRRTTLIGLPSVKPFTAEFAGVLQRSQSNPTAFSLRPCVCSRRSLRARRLKLSRSHSDNPGPLLYTLRDLP